jgi:hypothetical protein
MSDSIDINGKKLLPIKEAVALVDYSREMQLANLKALVMNDESAKKDGLTVESVKQRQDGVVEPVFSARTTMRDLEARSGILLLPDGEEVTVESVNEYFSDPVIVTIDEFGQRAVVRVNESGHPYGEPVPFVEVPINPPTNAQSP